MATIQDIFAPKPGNRYIVLGDKTQDFPKRCKVLSYEVKGPEGKNYVELACKDDEDNQIKISVFPRDVKACIDSWGSDPKNWGWIAFELNFTGNRYFLKPAKNQIDVED